MEKQVCSNPIFIIGSPRSGTSILAWSLAHHSQLWTSNESDIVWDLYGNDHVDIAFQRAKWRHREGWLNEQGVERAEFLGYVGLGLNALFTSRSQGKRWIDQTPDYTLMVDVLADMFPGALFLHIIRDGRSVVNSMIHFVDALEDDTLAKVGDNIVPHWVDFAQACRTWRQFTNIAMDFCAGHPKRCMTVVYEDLVAEPHKHFRNICAFLGADYEDGPTNFFQSSRMNSSFYQTIWGSPNFSPPSPKHVEEQKPFEPWKEWTPRDKLTFYWEAGPTLIKYGMATREELDSFIGDRADNVQSDFEGGRG